MLGHGLTEPNPFRQAKETELYLVDDLDITLPTIVSNNHLPTQLGETTVKGKVMCCTFLTKLQASLSFIFNSSGVFYSAFRKLAG